VEVLFSLEDIDSQILSKDSKIYSPLKTRQIAKCVHCKRLTNNISKLTQKQLQIQRDKMVAIRNLGMKQKSKNSVKVLNQSIRRKNQQIQHYKKRLKQLSALKRLSLN